MGRKTEFTTKMIMAALREAHGDTAGAAKAMGCNRNVIYDRVKVVKELRVLIGELRGYKEDASGPLQPLYKLIQDTPVYEADAKTGKVVVKSRGRALVFTTESMMTALRQAKGSVLAAGSALGCHPQVIYKRMREDKGLRVLLGQLRGYQEDPNGPLQPLVQGRHQAFEPKASNEELLAALRETGGDIKQALRGFSFSIWVFYHRIRTDDGFRLALMEIRAKAAEVHALRALAAREGVTRADVAAFIKGKLEERRLAKVRQEKVAARRREDALRPTTTKFRKFTREEIVAALRQTQGVVAKAARLLDCSVTMLHDRTHADAHLWDALLKIRGRETRQEASHARHLRDLGVPRRIPKPSQEAHAPH